ncbi:MAG: hypothetical protein ABSH24_24525 [Bryobacteraceae bacterium]|jgi:hypothetical protein
MTAKMTAKMTATETRQAYRKLPGRRRGVVFSASLWTAADHLLSVKSTRFQEQYKRFYFRDIQAIVVTKVPRLAVSTPVLAAAALLPIAALIARLRLPAAAGWLWLLMAALAAGWIYISIAQSCTCRLYTAVSREDLPSIYRMWTARKALAELEQRIAQVQGVFTENWAEAVDRHTLGPARLASGQPAEGRTRGAARSRTWVSDIFLASLFADAVATMYLMRSQVSWLADVSVALTVVQVASAVGIFVQTYRGILRTAMQRLAIVALLFIGGITYAQMIADTMTAALAGRRGPMAMRARARSGIGRPIYSGGAALLAIAGFVLSFKPE